MMGWTLRGTWICCFLFWLDVAQSQLYTANRGLIRIPHHASKAQKLGWESGIITKVKDALESPLVWPIKLDHMPPQIHRDAKRIRLYYGPYQIFGQKEPRGNSSQKINPEGMTISQTITGFCTNCTVLSAKTDTHYLNGTRASIATGIYDHHILILDPTKRDALPWWLCEGQTGLGNTKSAGFMVTGVDEAPNLYTVRDSSQLTGKVRSGYWVGEGQKKFNLNADLVNYWDTAQEVYITAETEFIEGRPAGWRDASVSLISVTGCKDPGYKPPHGTKQFEMVSEPFKFPKDGTIVSGKGHVHDGGVSIALIVNNQTVCESVAQYGGPGSVVSGPDGSMWQTIHDMSTCGKKIDVKKGDILTVKSMYDIEKHPMRKAANGHGEGEGMGTFFISFASTA